MSDAGGDRLRDQSFPQLVRRARADQPYVHSVQPIKFRWVGDDHRRKDSVRTDNLNAGRLDQSEWLDLSDWPDQLDWFDRANSRDRTNASPLEDAIQ